MISRGANYASCISRAFRAFSSSIIPAEFAETLRNENGMAGSTSIIHWKGRNP